MEAFLGEARAVWGEALKIWSDGGWAMMALAVIGLVIFGLGVHVFLRLSSKGYRSVPEEVWRDWINRPDDREGAIGKVLDFVTSARTIDDSVTCFEQVRHTESAPFERDLKVMKICVSAAPLVGLLGTVTGMLATFGALSSGAGGDETMGLVAEGISEALITTETGLVIALPGLFFQYHLARKHERYKAFLAHLESACTQALYRRLRRQRKAA